MVILTVSIGGLAILATNQWRTSKNVDVLDVLETTVASDLGWLKTYAKYWRITSGPYNITCTQAGFASGCTATTISSTTTEYDPDPNLNLCPNATSSTADTALASAFLDAAASVSLTPARPFTLAQGNTTLVENTGGSSAITDRRLPLNTSLVRNITLGKNVLYVSYSFTGSNAAPYRFLREAAVRPEASTWCP